MLYLMYQMKEEFKMLEIINLEMVCPFCGQVHSVDVFETSYVMYMAGAQVQDVFPYLSATQREQLSHTFALIVRKIFLEVFKMVDEVKCPKCGCELETDDTIDIDHEGSYISCLVVGHCPKWC